VRENEFSRGPMAHAHTALQQMAFGLENSCQRPTVFSYCDIVLLRYQLVGYPGLVGCGLVGE